MNNNQPVSLGQLAASIREIETSIGDLDAFRFGVLAALVSLKTAIQASPDFNATALEDSLTYFLANPPKTDYLDSWQGPLNALRDDRTDMLKQTLHQA
jgi:hypothetical protein